MISTFPREEGRREGEREGGMGERGREGGRKGGMGREREGGREGGNMSKIKCVYSFILQVYSSNTLYIPLVKGK